MRHERKEIITDNRYIQRFVRVYYKQVYAKKFENLGEMVKYLQTSKFLKVN